MCVQRSIGMTTTVSGEYKGLLHALSHEMVWRTIHVMDSASRTLHEEALAESGSLKMSVAYKYACTCKCTSV